MSTTIQLHQEARGILDRMMDREGALDDEDEVILEHWANASGDKIEALRAVYHRASAEAEHWKREAEKATALRKRAESLMVWTKASGLDLMLDRLELGQDTSIKGVGYTTSQPVLVAPEDPLDWPVAYLREQEPKPDRRAALQALKDGKDIGDGFSIESRPVMVYK
jgi:hypothetical protein